MVNNKIAQRAVAAGLSGLMAFGAAAPAALATGIEVKGFDWYNKNSNDDGVYFKRLGGDTRYDTMKKIVEAYNDYSYSTGITILGGLSTREAWNYHSTAVLASGDNYPDALAANGLAGYMTNESIYGNKGLVASYGSNGAVPVILTKSGTLSNQAKDLLKNMQVQNVIIMGGTAAVSQDVENTINNMGIGTQRVAGKDRQETSLKALQRINGNWNGRKGTYDLIIAAGNNYADALSISPYAYRMGTPIILTKSDGTLTDEQVKAIKDNDKIAEIVIVGGTSAVSDQVMGQIGTVRNNSYGIHYTRIAGADRYETSAKIAEFEVASWTDYYNQAWSSSKIFNTYRDYPGSIWQFLGYGTAFSFDHVVVARGDDFPDALAGGQLAGGVAFDNVDGFETAIWNPCPLLLTKDGDTRAENVIASQISKRKVAADYDYFFTNNTWDAFVKKNYTAGGTVFDALNGKWYTYATKWGGYSKSLAYETFPFYLSIDGMMNGIAATDTPVYNETTIKYIVKESQVDGKPIFELLQSDPAVVKDVTFDEDGIHVKTTDKYNGQTWNRSKNWLEGNIGTNWNKVTNQVITVTFQGDQTGTVKKGTIDDKYVIRFVGETDNFYGIILGGTSAVSNKKRDDLDKAVASHISVNNYYYTSDGALADTVTWGDKDWGVNIHYTKLIFEKTEGNLDYFRVAATAYGMNSGDLVTHNNDTGVWTYLPAV